MNRNLLLAACFVLLVVLAVAVGFARRHQRYARTDADRDLQAAKTAGDELAAFGRIALNPGVEISVHDAAGNRLDMATTDWPNTATLVRFHHFGEPVLEHVLIEKRNVYALIQE
jgi:hypothetical protein